MMKQNYSDSFLKSSRDMTEKFVYTDEELIGRFQRGDENAYIELVHRYKDRLMVFVYRFVNVYDSGGGYCSGTQW